MDNPVISKGGEPIGGNTHGISVNQDSILVGARERPINGDRAAYDAGGVVLPKPKWNTDIKTHFEKLTDKGTPLCNSKSWNGFEFKENFSEITCSKCLRMVQKMVISPEIDIEKQVTD